MLGVTDRGLLTEPHYLSDISLNYYPANATLVCVLSAISSAVTLFFCSGSDISATVTAISLKVCMLVEMCPMTMLLSFWWRYLYGFPNAGLKGLQVDHFWPFRHHFFPFYREYLENGKSQLDDSFLTRVQSNLTKSASRGAYSPVRGHLRGSKFVPLNSWGRVSY